MGDASSPGPDNSSKYATQERRPDWEKQIEQLNMAH